MENNKKFWNFSLDTPGKAKLDIYGTIAQEESWWSDTVSAKRFNQELDDLNDVSEIIVRINSPGGDPFAATAIMNRLKGHSAKVTVEIEGIAASAATIVAMAGDDIKIAKNGMFMIHNPKVVTYGQFETADLEKLQNELGAIKKTIITTYAERTGRDEQEISDLMDAETWWTGAEAVENKFCDRLLFEESKNTIQNNGAYFVNSMELNAECYGKMPEKIKQIFNKQPMPAKEVETKKTEEKNMEIKDCTALRAAFPDLVNQIETAARTAERERIKEIEDMALPGFEELVNKAKYTDVKNTAADIAKEIVKAQRKENREQLENMKADIEKSNVNNVPAAGASNQKLFKNEQERQDAEFKALLKKITE